MSMRCKVKLSAAGILRVTPQTWNLSTFRINRIHVPLEGMAKYRDVNGEKTLRTGNLYLLINGFSQDLSMVPNTPYNHLYLDFQCLPPLFSRELLEIALEKDAYVHDLLGVIRRLIEAGAEIEEGRFLVSADDEVFFEVEQALTLLLLYLQRRYSLDVVENEKIEDAVRFIQRHYQEPIQNEDVARALHIDNRYLIRLFTRYVAMSPYQYLTQCRIEQAAHMLRSGRSVTDTAFACGYQSETAFRLAFKRVMGCTPNSVKASLKKQK